MIFNSECDAIRFYIGGCLEPDTGGVTFWPSELNYNANQLGSHSKDRKRKLDELSDEEREDLKQWVKASNEALKKFIQEKEQEGADLEALRMLREVLPETHTTTGCSFTPSASDETTETTQKAQVVSGDEGTFSNRAIARVDLARIFRTFIAHHGEWAFEVLLYEAINEKTLLKKASDKEEKRDHELAKKEFYEYRKEQYSLISQNASAFFCTESNVKCSDRKAKETIERLKSDLQYLLFMDGYLTKIDASKVIDLTDEERTIPRGFTASDLPGF